MPNSVLKEPVTIALQHYRAILVYFRPVRPILECKLAYPSVINLMRLMLRDP